MIAVICPAAPETQWVRYFETAGVAPAVSRPAGVEGWLPIAALMKYFIVTRDILEVHPAGMFLPIAFLAISIAFGTTFCSWLCPIGTHSEWLWQGSRDLFRRNFSLPRCVVGYAKAAGHWSGNIPVEVFFELIPKAASFSHP